MSVAVNDLAGNPSIPEHAGHQTKTGFGDVDQALAELVAKKEAWTKVSVRDRVALLRQVARDTAAVADAWAAAGIDGRKLPRGTPIEGEDYATGPWPTIRCARLYAVTLEEIADTGRLDPGKTWTRPNGQSVARVFPETLFDRLLFDRVSVEIWMEPGVSEKQIADEMAPNYLGEPRKAGVALVLGAGNVSAISSTDVLHKLFVDNEVTILKMNPVNDYAGPFIEKSFKSLIDAGWVRVVYGGIDVGSYLCEHDSVESIHMTGSDKTHDAIRFGTGDEGAKRKASRQVKNERPMSCELGNVTPTIVVPGAWSVKDHASTGEAIASHITANVGFNCVTARTIINHEGWKQRDQLLDGIRSALQNATERYPYYPGARDRYLRFTEAHPEAERFGADRDDNVPFTLIPGVDSSNAHDIVFTTEAFAPLFAETTLEANSVPEFIAQAVEFCNDTLWGTLAAHIVVHPSSLKDPAVRDAVEDAIEKLRYGTVAVNTWSGLSFLLMNGHWGAFPGHDPYDIQSGTGWVHNTRMHGKPQKTVIRAPFRPMTKPIWYPSHKTPDRVASRLCQFEAAPSLGRLTPVAWHAMRG